MAPPLHECPLCRRAASCEQSDETLAVGAALGEWRPPSHGEGGQAGERARESGRKRERVDGGGRMELHAKRPDGHHRGTRDESRRDD